MKITYPKFATKKELFAYLVKNKKDIIELKKAALKFTDDFGISAIEKAILKEYNGTTANDTADVIYRTIIGNTYLWMDSHDDVHLTDVFAKSIKDRGEKIYHLHDHLRQVTAKVGVPQKVYEAYIDWTKLGVNKAGQTQALFMDSAIKKELNPQVFGMYRDKEINQHSVAMQYVQLCLCINDPEDKEEFANWNMYIDLLGNRADAEEQGYFWVVKEAKLIEISCVLEGSNELTPTLEPDTQKEPVITTLPEPPKEKFNVKKAIETVKFFN